MHGETIKLLYLIVSLAVNAKTSCGLSVPADVAVNYEHEVRFLY